MDINEAITGRRSIRKYLANKRIEEDKLLDIIEAGNNAPSHCNTQAWKFIIIKDKKLKKRLVEMDAASFIMDSPLVIAVLYDNRTDNLEYMDYVQSAAACIQNMLLKAHSLGVGGCWVCHLPQKKQMRKLFKIPSYYDPIAILTLGYPAVKKPLIKRKKKVEELVCYNYFGFSKENDKIGLTLKRTARKIYYKLPFKKYIRKKVNNIFEKKFE